MVASEDGHRANLKSLQLRVLSLKRLSKLTTCVNFIREILGLELKFRWSEDMTYFDDTLSQKPVRIKAPRQEFEAAIDGGYAYGRLDRRIRIPVYVELGAEREYIASPRNDLNTDYRFFVNCNVFVAKTEDQLDREVYIAEWFNVSVILMC